MLGKEHLMDRLFVALVRLQHDLSTRHDDRGDVPGWVMVVVMTAALCAGLLKLAGPQLSQMLTDSLNQVK
jgi:hypothetical protein